MSIMAQVIEKIGAGEGNRTLVISLEGCCSTIELHPRRVPASWSVAPAFAKATAGNLRRAKTGLPTEAAQRRRLVGEVGLEPTKA
jgi:hypothetical protein